MKIGKYALAALSVMAIFALIGCQSGPKATYAILDSKGHALGQTETPAWVTTYTSYGVSRLQSQTEYRDKYCIIGEETGVNLQFVRTWADNFSAQQRIGAMLRTNIESLYQAKMTGEAQSTGVTGVTPSTGAMQQKIDSSINAVVNVSYSGAQLETDWWILSRRYDPDLKDVYTDQYTAWVLYTIPKTVLNSQIADALRTSVEADSELYAITIQIAEEILLNGIRDWGE